jgi:hypothetical protein
MGSLYGTGGDRWDWQLSLFRDGSFQRRVIAVHRPQQEISEKRAWVCEADKVLVLTPTEGKSSAWWIHDVTRLERAPTLLVLREAILRRGIYRSCFIAFICIPAARRPRTTLTASRNREGRAGIP